MSTTAAKFLREIGLQVHFGQLSAGREARSGNHPASRPLDETSCGSNLKHQASPKTASTKAIRLEPRSIHHAQNSLHQAKPLLLGNIHQTPATTGQPPSKPFGTKVSNRSRPGRFWAKRRCRSTWRIRRRAKAAQSGEWRTRSPPAKGCQLSHPFFFFGWEIRFSPKIDHGNKGTLTDLF